MEKLNTEKNIENTRSLEKYKLDEKIIKLRKINSTLSGLLKLPLEKIKEIIK